MNSTRGGSFFRTMVLMGSSLALSCGGMAEDGSSGADGSGGSDDPGGGGGTPGAGGGTGVGGTALGTGGQGIIILLPSTGGTSGVGGFGGAYPTDCPTMQLSCVAESISRECGNGRYLILPAGCECDPTRPQSRRDCAQDEDFVCLGASESVAGETFDEVVPYACECVPASATGCNSVCDLRTGQPRTNFCEGPEASLPDLDAYLCGCALTVLK